MVVRHMIVRGHDYCDCYLCNAHNLIYFCQHYGTVCD